MNVVLLSGDAVGPFARRRAAGIRECVRTFFLPPRSRSSRVRRLREEGRHVGDGVNDAPRSRRLTWESPWVGNADAVESSGITLMRDDIALVPEAMAIARRTVRTMKQNIVWAFFYNSIGLVLAVTGVLNPLIAAGAMVVSSLSVVLNSMRLREREGRALECF